jgi:HEAT repeat protein
MELLRPGAPAGAAAGAVASLQAQADAQDKDDKKKPFLEQIAKLNDPAVRAAEAKMAPLADGAGPAALAPLLKAVRDTEGVVAVAASDALGRIGAPAVPALVAMLGDANDTVAYYASQALGQVGAPAVDSLLPAAQPGKPAARWAAVALGEIRDPRAVAPLEALSQSPDADTAFAAGAALAKVKGQGS